MGIESASTLRTLKEGFSPKIGRSRMFTMRSSKMAFRIVVRGIEVSVSTNSIILSLKRVLYMLITKL